MQQFDLDPPRRLALAYARRADRAALAALFALDLRLAAIVAATREPMLGEIRLAWWREAIEALAAGPRAGEPLLEALHPLVRDRGVDPARLAALATGWTALLAPLPLGPDALAAYAEGRGSTLFALAAAIAGRTPAGIDEAGAAWALCDLVPRISDATTAAAARALGDRHLAAAPRRWPIRLRPLAVLLAVARLESPFRVIWAGLSGRC